MPIRLTEPGPQTRQICGRHADGSYVLTVVAKRSYRVLPEGTCSPVPESLPLVVAPEEDEEAGILLHDSDLQPMKPGTDVIVAGHAYGYDGRTSFEAGIRVGDHVSRILVVGDRRVERDASGRPAFTPPEPVDAVPLLYTHAYGGRDRASEDRHGNPFIEMFGEEARHYPDLARISPWEYPRNPAGRGYLVEWHGDAEGTPLPNLEDPWDPLTPDRLLAGEPGRWTRMPLPRGTGWLDYGWFPRVACFGIVPPFAPLPGPVEEVRRGWAPEDVMEMPRPTHAGVLQGMAGASLGLQLPFLAGGEWVQLDSLHPEQEKVAFQLPDDRPGIWTDGRKGRFQPTHPVLHTIFVEPDEDRVSLVWAGSAPALRPYSAEELEAMPLHVEWSW
jgi:hypothetical protein